MQHIYKKMSAENLNQMIKNKMKCLGLIDSLMYLEVIKKDIKK